VFKEATNGEIFEDFIGELLQLCERGSVFIMDNASFHRSEKVRQLCADAGIQLVYLPPYSPDLNPIEEFFAQLKAYIRRKMRTMDPGTDFAEFLEACIEEVGRDGASARGHFRNAGISFH